MQPLPSLPKVHVVHAAPLVASGICATLAAAGHLLVARTPDSAAATAGAGDVVVTDIEDGMRMLAERRTPTPRVIVLAAQVRDFEVREAIHAGASGFLSLGCETEELVACVTAVQGGTTYVCRAAAQCVIASMIQPALTSRETDVLQLVALGRCNKSIANRLGISIGTTKSHVSSLMGKLGATTRTEAARIAAERGFLRSSAVGDPSARAGGVGAPAQPPHGAHAMARVGVRLPTATGMAMQC